MAYWGIWPYIHISCCTHETMYHVKEDSWGPYLFFFNIKYGSFRPFVPADKHNISCCIYSPNPVMCSSQSKIDDTLKKKKLRSEEKRIFILEKVQYSYQPLRKPFFFSMLSFNPGDRVTVMGSNESILAFNGDWQFFRAVSAFFINSGKRHKGRLFPFKYQINVTCRSFCSLLGSVVRLSQWVWTPGQQSNLTSVLHATFTRDKWTLFYYNLQTLIPECSVETFFLSNLIFSKQELWIMRWICGLSIHSCGEILKWKCLIIHWSWTVEHE